MSTYISSITTKSAGTAEADPDISSHRVSCSNCKLGMQDFKELSSLYFSFPTLMHKKLEVLPSSAKSQFSWAELSYKIGFRPASQPPHPGKLAAGLIWLPRVRE